MNSLMAAISRAAWTAIGVVGSLRFHGFRASSQRCGIDLLMYWVQVTSGLPRNLLMYIPLLPLAAVPDEYQMAVLSIEN